MIVPKRASVTSKEDVINVSAIAKSVWANRITVFKFIISGVFIGVFSVIFGQKEYRSSATLMPEYNAESSGGSGLLSRYGSLFGINTGSFGSSGSSINVMLYPNIVNSTEFQLQVLHHEYYFQSIDDTLSLYDYFRDEQKSSVTSTIVSYTVGLPSKIYGFFADIASDSEQESEALQTGNASILNLSGAEYDLTQMLRKRINASINLETGILNVSAVMPDKYVAAQVTDYVVNLLTQYIIDYTVNKELLDLAFIEEQLLQSTRRFEDAQEEIAAFREQYRGNMSIRNQTEEQRLESNYQVAFNLYNTLVQQREQAKLRVQEQTPVFNTLEKAKVPKNDETSGKVVLIFSVFLSIVASFAWLIIRDRIKPVLQSSKNS